MHTHTDTIHQIKINCIVIYFFTAQVMDSQVNSEALNNLLENDTIWPNIDLLGSDPDTNSREDMHITKPFSILNELVDSPPTRNSINTTTSTPSCTITHPLSCMIVTTTYSTINTTNPTHTLRHQPTAATLPLIPKHILQCITFTNPHTSTIHFHSKIQIHTLWHTIRAFAIHLPVHSKPPQLYLKT